MKRIIEVKDKESSLIKKMNESMSNGVNTPKEEAKIEGNTAVEEDNTVDERDEFYSKQIKTDNELRNIFKNKSALDVANRFPKTFQALKELDEICDSFCYDKKKTSIQELAEKIKPMYDKFNKEFTKLDGENTNGYEMVNHPAHYNSSSIETIEKMRRIWGNEATALWCEMTAFKYRDRIGNKPLNSNDQEVGKIKWYENKAKELRESTR